MASTAENTARVHWDERTWLAWLVKSRIIIITVLLAVQLAVSRFTQSKVPEELFVGIILLWYTISVFYLLLLQQWRDYGLQARLQIITDLALATAIIYVTGGAETYFNFLYALIIIMASILLPRGWSYLTAALAFIMFGAVLELPYFFQAIPSYSSARPDLKSLQAVIFINLFAYIAIAYLASRLTGRLRQAGVQLKRMGGELENLQALHANIINSMRGGLITTGLDGRITLVNAGGERLLERAATALLGRQVAQVFQGGLPDAGSSVAHTETRGLMPSGEEKMFGITATALRVPGRGIIGYVYTFDDLTEIRRLEREVRLRDRMAAVGRMAAGIAHEIRNPLSSIAGSVKVLAGISALNQEQRTLVDIVTRESERLDSIITDFLAYSRGKTYRFSRVDLVSLLEDTLTLLENQERPEAAPQIRVERDLGVESAESDADGDSIKQVFWNICQNAVRAMSETGGTLRVELRSENDCWVIRFSDTGPGLTPQQMEKVFEPFQSQFGSVGLGLAIVYQIVHAHDGRLSVRSKRGEGAEFILELKHAAAPDEFGALHAAKVTHG